MVRPPTQKPKREIRSHHSYSLYSSEVFRGVRIKPAGPQIHFRVILFHYYDFQCLRHENMKINVLLTYSIFNRSYCLFGMRLKWLSLASLNQAHVFTPSPPLLVPGWNQQPFGCMFPVCVFKVGCLTFAQIHMSECVCRWRMVVMEYLAVLTDGWSSALKSHVTDGCSVHTHHVNDST